MSLRPFSILSFAPGRASEYGRVGLCLLICLGLGACNPYSDIRSELSAPDRARFDRGLRAATPCWSCHDLTGNAIKVGPPLAGLFGQEAGFVKGFPYSPAFRASRVVWDRRSLDRFLVDPQGLIPQNRMISNPLEDSGRRSDLIFFLRMATDQTPAD